MYTTDEIWSEAIEDFATLYVKGTSSSWAYSLYIKCTNTNGVLSFSYNISDSEYYTEMPPSYVTIFNRIGWTEGVKIVARYLIEERIEQIKPSKRTIKKINSLKSKLCQLTKN